MKTKHQTARHSRENGNPLFAKHNLYFLGLSSFTYQLSRSTGYALLLRHKCFAQKLQRGIRFYSLPRNVSLAEP